MGMTGISPADRSLEEDAAASDDDVAEVVIDVDVVDEFFFKTN